jgi:hypothetical protein
MEDGVEREAGLSQVATWRATRVAGNTTLAPPRRTSSPGMP